jgi:hypothetical protein
MYLYIYIYTCIYIYIYMFIYIYIYMFIYIYIYTYIYIHIYPYIHTYIYITYIHIYIHCSAEAARQPEFAIWGSNKGLPAPFCYAQTGLKKKVGRGGSIWGLSCFSFFVLAGIRCAAWASDVWVYVCIYIHILYRYIHIFVYIHIYIYI